MSVMNSPRYRGKRAYIPKPRYIAIIIFLIVALVSILQDRFDDKGRSLDEGSKARTPAPTLLGTSNEYVRIKRVNDGDTVTVVINNREEMIRLIGIDAPELGQKPWGERSKRELQKIIRETDKTVRVELDIEKTDKYGRVLAYLWTRDGRLINEEMLKRGYALLYTVPPNVRYVDRLKEAQEFASKKRIGIWKEKGLEQSPSDYRKTHPRH